MLLVHGMIVRLDSGRHCCRLLCIVAALIASGDGRAQNAPSPTLGLQEQGSPEASPAPPQPSAPEPQAPAPRVENPGLFNEMGKLFDKILPLKKPGDAEADKNSGSSSLDALSKLVKPSSMVSGRMSCPAAPNGTPDCQSGALKLCQSKGYKDGRSLNTDFAEHCSPKVLIPGRARKPDDCRTDAFVTSALCQ